MTANKTPSEEEVRKTGQAMSLGMLGGAAVGVILWILTDSFIWFPVFVGCGLSVGVAVGAKTGEKEQE